MRQKEKLMPRNITAAEGGEEDQYDWDNEQFGSMADYATDDNQVETYGGDK